MDAKQEKKQMERKWSQYQEAIFQFVKTGEGNAIVEAVAGSGKTTTIVEALKHCNGSTIFLAFNKAIAEELKQRGVNAKTFHGLTFSPVLRAKPGRVLDNDKTRKIFREMWEEDKTQEMYLSFVCRLVSLGKQNGLDCLRPNSEESWIAIVEHHELELDHEDAQEEVAIEMAKKLLTASNTHPEMVDFDDMLYLSVRDGISLPKFDFVFVDEAQDTNAIQRAILKKLFRSAPHSGYRLKNETRIIAVGDPAQAIYGFRGADSDSMSKIQDEFHCIRLPLTVSYRCPQAVVQHARKWVEHIEPAPSAPNGEVRDLGETWKCEDFQASDMVVCRTTRPLIALGYSLLKAKKPFFIMGRDIGLNLRKLVEKQKAKNIETLSQRLDAWCTREVEKALAKDDEGKVAAVQDKHDALMALITELPENARTVAELLRVIDILFQEKSNATILCTIHKSKGLESNKVWWLNSSQCPAKWASGWQFKQEENLCYVATTRAKNQLNLIEEARK
jgi:DNA helicase-2/ATP-dependent DNA helicase PcrA